MTYMQTTNHPLGKVLEEGTHDILTRLLRHDSDGTTQPWRQDGAPDSSFIRADHLSGVVDPRMKIYGLSNVRVVDASVIPLTTGVAIQSTVYAIAEKVRPKISMDRTD